MEINYTHPEELLVDPSFINWASGIKGKDHEEWEKHLAVADPTQKTIVQQALEMLAGMVVQEEVPQTQVDNAEHRLMESLQTPVRRIAPIRRYWWSAAAAILLLIGGTWFYRATSKQSVCTPYGHIASQHLPDGSEVMLNANSSISYNDKREVWIQGEAFFHVKKTPDKRRFTVHGNGFDVIVTGTQFNVVNRNNRMSVLLQEGSVILKTADGREVQMKPGEYVDVTNAQLQKTAIKDDKMLAWKDHKLVFDNTPIKDAIAIINEQYGTKIKLSDDSIGNKSISFILPNDNLDVLLKSLEATNEFKVNRVNDTIFIAAP